jgi:hypothetical protein
MKARALTPCFLPSLPPVHLRRCSPRGTSCSAAAASPTPYAPRTRTHLRASFCHTCNSRALQRKRKRIANASQTATQKSINGALNLFGLKLLVSPSDPTAWSVSDGRAFLKRFEDGMIVPPLGAPGPGRALALAAAHGDAGAAAAAAAAAGAGGGGNGMEVDDEGGAYGGGGYGYGGGRGRGGFGYGGGRGGFGGRGRGVRYAPY